MIGTEEGVRLDYFFCDISSLFIITCILLFDGLRGNCCLHGDVALVVNYSIRSGTNYIVYEDLVAYAEETGDMMAVRDAGAALDALDRDGDGKISIFDFIYFALKLKEIHESGKKLL